jgi:glycogen debranching enzyme
LDDVIQVKQQFYVLATSTVANAPSRVLKYGDTCGVFDLHGDMRSAGFSRNGLYHAETRHLSRFVLQLEDQALELLGSIVKKHDSFLAADLTNVDFKEDGKLKLPRGSLHFFRSKFIWEATCYEELRVSNFAMTLVKQRFSFLYGADFADIFEVRGTKRAKHGDMLQTEITEDSVIFSYRGLDGVVRRTHLCFEPKPLELSESRAQFELKLKPREEALFWVTTRCEQTRVKTAKSFTFADARKQVRAQNTRLEEDRCHISTSDSGFNEWLECCESDLQMMTVGNPEKWYPYAGVPWFNTVFGRDGIITAMEALWKEPAYARGVLKYLAETQADKVSPEQDAQPGKILHEMRTGEMAATKEIPFGRYYGSIDATPLYVMLAAAYYRRTADLEFIKTIWTNVERALRWIDEYGDLDADGFVEYSKQSPEGLVQQGWKDSGDSVFYEDGELASGPIALCEVQGYVYAAKMGAAELARRLGLTAKADRLTGEAAELQNKFDKSFWDDEIGTYVLALDGKKRKCRVRASNAGQCLATGIVIPSRAGRVADGLLDENSFSGWGIRTLDAREMRYNPMSYHNGSVWPHDNALIALGLSRYGFASYAVRVLESMYESSSHFDSHRLPELFCGFHKREDDGPTPYPVACSPQSWAAGAVYMLLQACLGLSIDAERNELSCHAPHLPSGVHWVQIENLKVGNRITDIRVSRDGDGRRVRVESNAPELQVRVTV